MPAQRTERQRSGEAQHTQVEHRDRSHQQNYADDVDDFHDRIQPGVAAHRSRQLGCIQPGEHADRAFHQRSSIVF